MELATFTADNRESDFLSSRLHLFTSWEVHHEIKAVREIALAGIAQSV
jgi:hypothetical protein